MKMYSGGPLFYTDIATKEDNLLKSPATCAEPMCVILFGVLSEFLMANIFSILLAEMSTKPLQNV